MAGRTAQLPLNVRNNGVLPAAARIEMELHPAFTLLEGAQVRCAAALHVACSCCALCMAAPLRALAKQLANPHAGVHG